MVDLVRAPTRRTDNRRGRWSVWREPAHAALRRQDGASEGAPVRPAVGGHGGSRRAMAHARQAHAGACGATGQRVTASSVTQESASAPRKRPEAWQPYEGGRTAMET